MNVPKKLRTASQIASVLSSRLLGTARNPSAISVKTAVWCFSFDRGECFSFGTDQVGNKRPVGDIENHCQDTSRQRHHVKVLHAQNAHQCNKWNARQQRGTPQVCAGKQPSARKSVDPYACEHADQEYGRRFGRE